MDKIKLLQTRRQQLKDAGKAIRKDIETIFDEDSFVEFSCFSFSKNDFYGENAEGEGVVTGFATIADYPFYVVAQNSAVLSGGVSKANCRKIEKCLDQAEKSRTPVIYLLSSLGVQIGEGVNVLEGLATLILKASQLKGSIPQYLIVNGEVYGQIAILAGICDFNFFIDGKSLLAANSPFVISAKNGVNLGKDAVGGVSGLKNAGLVSFSVKEIAEAAKKIAEINELLAIPVIDCDDLNESKPVLNQKTDAKAIIDAFDQGYAIEVGSDYSPEVKCLLGRIGGIAVAATIFDGCDEGVELTASNIRKAKDFAEFASCYELPYITFVNTLGIKPDLGTNDSIVLKEIGEYISILDCIDAAKISVVYGKAIGLGYTVFAAKSMGYDYSFAFANAKIALFDSIQGAEIEFTGNRTDKQKLAEKYAEENSDPINAAKDGYIDNIIEPAHLRQYLTASLQMLLK